MSHLRSNGRPESEVIVNFVDGQAYNKTKLEEIYRSGFLEKPVKSKDQAAASVKADVDLIVHELDISRAEAEKTLIEYGGDVRKALEKLIAPVS
ncbi:hypothetical protein K474DRAFT_1589499 [Panus rudis PR-1116 ss-1]|nr:hypothetical protein K474DRAFT_1589499 [Panus rudis PR-1116 ss-1]